jgi:hypothetical protein
MGYDDFVSKRREPRMFGVRFYGRVIDRALDVFLAVFIGIALATVLVAWWSS